MQNLTRHAPIAELSYFHVTVQTLYVTFYVTTEVCANANLLPHTSYTSRRISISQEVACGQLLYEIVAHYPQIYFKMRPAACHS